MQLKAKERFENAKENITSAFINTKESVKDTFTKENITAAKEDIKDAFTNTKESVKDTFTKENIKNAFTKENAKGALKNVFNTLTFRKGGMAAFSGYGAVASATGLAFSVAAIVTTGGLAAPLLLIGVDLISGAVNINNSRVAANKHSAKKGLTV